jgi:hypothetical protein
MNESIGKTEELIVTTTCVAWSPVFSNSGYATGVPCRDALSIASRSFLL